MKHLTQELLEKEAQKIVGILQNENIQLKNILSEQEYKEKYDFLCGATYGIFLLMKYVELGGVNHMMNF